MQNQRNGYQKTSYWRDFWSSGGWVPYTNVLVLGGILLFSIATSKPNKTDWVGCAAIETACLSVLAFVLKRDIKEAMKDHCPKCNGSLLWKWGPHRAYGFYAVDMLCPSCGHEYQSEPCAPPGFGPASNIMSGRINESIRKARQ